MRARQLLFTVFNIYLLCHQASAVVNSSNQQKLDESKKSSSTPVPASPEKDPPPVPSHTDTLAEATGRKPTVAVTSGAEKPNRRKYSSSGYNSFFGLTPPLSKYYSKGKYGLPKPVYGPPLRKPIYGVPHPRPVYGVPHAKPVYGVPHAKPVYGVPHPKPVYGVPHAKPVYGVPHAKPIYGVPPPNHVYGTPFGSSASGAGLWLGDSYGFSQHVAQPSLDINEIPHGGLGLPLGPLPPKPVYGVPDSTAGAFLSGPAPEYGVPQVLVATAVEHQGHQSPNPSGAAALHLPQDGLWLTAAYGPPQPSPNPRPPHPGVGAPPTPPDIKYDGWQPIPGLVSHGHHEEHEGLVPPLPADSYGAPLSTVTGAGGVVASSGEEVHGGSSIEGLVPPARHPVQHREPVPQAVFANIESAALGGGDHGPTYLPPPVLDLPHGSLSYQSVSLGSATEGLNQPAPPSSYGVPLGAVDGTYGVRNPSGSSISLDFSHPPVSIDLTDGSARSNNNNYPCDLSSSSSETKVSVVAPVEEEGGDSHGKSYGQSVAASFGSSGELVEAQSIDLNNINLNGNLGSYTLQIQQAGGERQNGGGDLPVPHAQVLNEGLLQSILAAIEQQPRQNEATKDDALQLIDDNEIALYFNNGNAENRSESAGTTTSDDKSNNKTT